MAVLVIAGFAVGGVLGHGGFFAPNVEYSGSQSAAVSKAIESIKTIEKDAVKAIEVVTKATTVDKAVSKDQNITSRISNDNDTSFSPVEDDSNYLSQQCGTGVVSTATLAFCQEICDGTHGNWSQTVIEDEQGNLTNEGFGACNSLSVTPGGGTDLPDSVVNHEFKNQMRVGDSGVDDSNYLSQQCGTGVVSTATLAFCQEICDGTHGNWSQTVIEDEQGNLTNEGFGACNSLSVTPGGGTDLPDSVVNHEFKNQMRVGDSGVDVVYLQTLLQKMGLYTSVVDGRFGLETAAALRAFQRIEIPGIKTSKKLTTGRLAGKLTLKDLNAIVPIINDAIGENALIIHLGGYCMVPGVSGWGPSNGVGTICEIDGVLYLPYII